MHVLVSIGTCACSFIIFGAVDIWTVVERPVASADGPAPPLVQEMPVEAGERSVLGALVLHKQGALLSPEFLQISRGAEMEQA